MSTTTPLRALQNQQSNIPFPQPAFTLGQPTYTPPKRTPIAMSDSASPSASPDAPAKCFCGKLVQSIDGSIYCSVDCARSDAFSSLCYKPTYPSSCDMRDEPSSSTSASLSRNPSTASSITSADEEWNASHYRRVARADMRREERREERKRARSSRSTISSVPELVGGHSRNVSVASTASSAYTVGSLSRNPSTASSSSRRYNGFNIDTPIMEDEDEEWLTDPRQPYSRPYVRKLSRGLSGGRMKQLEAFGMGKDMRDVLDEIIQMEKGFSLSDTEENDQPGIFTATFDKPPRTPSPMAVDKRISQIPPAPGGPPRGHRPTQSHAIQQTPRRRPPSMTHHSSLSESHTALYLATASPAGPGRRSISPRLQARNSLTFTPDKAGPSLRLPRFDSPNMMTPSKRNITPSARHPAMDGWKFPTSNAATPTRPPPINTTNLPGNFATPRSHSTGEVPQVSPQLLWPPSALPPPLAPALFPSSPAVNTPDYTMRPSLSDSSLPPHSGLRLGVLLGSGDEDVDMDDDDSTAHGHGVGTGYLPVFLEAEGFRRGYDWE